MVVAASCVQNRSFDARGAPVVAPILLSPIAVAHRTQMLDNEAEKPSTGNIIRDQWVANLQKRTAAGAGISGDPIGSGNPLVASFSRPLSNSSTTSSNRSNRSHAAKRCSRTRSAASRAVKNNKSLTQRRHNHFVKVPSGLVVDSQIAMSKDGERTMGHASMLFSDMDYLDLESPSFSRLIASSLDNDPFSSPTNEIKMKLKRGTITGLKKRATRCVALDLDQSKPHTPRRKLNCGSATFDDFNLDYSIDLDPSGFSGVGTPSNFYADAASCANVRHLWSQDLDLSDTGAYADTFLDLPTPRLADMPLMNTNSIHLREEQTGFSPKVDPPIPIRNEQDCLSHFLEQTNLDGSDNNGQGQELWTNGCKSPFSNGSFFTSKSDATAKDIEECLGVKSTTLMQSPSLVHCFSKPGIPTSRRCVSTSDKKQLSDLETLMDEYRFTDIDHELDSFYLDTIESSIGNDLDLMTN